MMQRRPSKERQREYISAQDMMQIVKGTLNRKAQTSILAAERRTLAKKPRCEWQSFFIGNGMQLDDECLEEMHG